MKTKFRVLRKVSTTATSAFLRGARTLGLAAALCGLGWMPAHAQSDEIVLTWHGQGTTVIETEGDTLLIDAFFVQNIDIPIPPALADLPGDVKLILLTHGHADHFGNALDLLNDAAASDPPKDLLLAANSELVRNLVSYGLADPRRVIDMNKGGKLVPGQTIQLGRLVPGFNRLFPDVGGVAEIIMVPAEHSSSLFIPLGLPGREDVGGTFVTGGEAVGYLIRFKTGFTLYHAGDTYVFEEMRTIGERHDIDLALLPIGGNFTMDPVDAAFAAVELLRPRFVIPIHYAQGAPRGFSPALTGTPEQFVEALGRRRNVKVVIPERGQQVLLTGAGPNARVTLLGD
ncbi:MAG: MBL fold metallo-hydrolase [Acidiferrobacterales bacterium]